MKILGIDPGLNGGAAVIDVSGPRPRLLAAIDLPTHGEGAKRRVDASAFHAWIAKLAPDEAFIERAQAMPDQGASSGFIYGRAVGTAEACVACAGVPLTIVEASVWKRQAGLSGGPGGKESARQRAIQTFPEGSGAFARKKDHQRAEAALIAKHGHERGTIPQQRKTTTPQKVHPLPGQWDLLAGKVE